MRLWGVGQRHVHPGRFMFVQLEVSLRSFRVSVLYHGDWRPGLLQLLFFFDGIWFDTQDLLHTCFSLLDMMESSLFFRLQHLDPIVQALNIIFDLFAILTHLILGQGGRPDQWPAVGLYRVEKAVWPGCRREELLHATLTLVNLRHLRRSPSKPCVISHMHVADLRRLS